MLPNPALEPAATWIPPIISVTLFLVFFVMWAKSNLDRIRKLEEKNELQDKAFQSLLLELGAYVKVEDLSRTVNGVWKVVRKIDKQQFAQRIQLNLPAPPRELEDEDDTSE
jgi:cytochrome oxidase assembly protein ShyY1